MAAVSTYPFVIFAGDWKGRFSEEDNFPIKGDTVIGNDVWTGYNCTIMPGVNIGDGAVIAAEAVVCADVPPYAIVAGNPARIIRMRCSEEAIKSLLEIKWWTSRKSPVICQK